MAAIARARLATDTSVTEDTMPSADAVPEQLVDLTKLTALRSAIEVDLKRCRASLQDLEVPLCRRCTPDW